MRKLYSQAASGFLVALAADIVSKYWIDTTFAPFQPHPVLGEFFRLTLGYNTGVAFNLFDNSGIFPVLLTGTIILGGAIWAIFALRRSELPAISAFPVGAIGGGALGNFIDRVTDGRVTDFLDFGLSSWRFATFNLADTAIVLGVITLMLLMLLEKPMENETPSPEI